MTTTPTNRFTRFLHRSEEPKDSKASVETPTFEDSIGVEYRKIGRFRCWEATGHVRRKFLVLRVYIEEYLKEHGPDNSTPVIWSVYMIGKSKKSSYPVVLFCNKEISVRKAARKQIEDSGILANFPGFKTGDFTQPPEFDQQPRPLASDDGDVSLPSENMTAICDNPTGRLVSTQQCGPHGSVRRKSATVGTVFSWDGLLLFTTASHAFFEHDCVINFEGGDELDLDLSFDAEGLDVESVESSEDDGAPEGFQRPPENRGLARDVTTSNIRTEALSSRKSETSPAFDRDDVVLSSKDGPNPGLDYCLVMWKGRQPADGTRVPVAHSLCNYHVVQPRMRASDMPRDVAVVAYTGSGNARGGMLSGTPSLMTLPGGRKTQELWLVRLDGALAEGDCGSVVVNKETGDLEGHIVAGSPGSGNAYIIPAHGMLQDIRRRLPSRLQIWTRFSNCGPRVPTTAINSREAWALAGRFREILSEARKAKLSQARRSRSTVPQLHIHNIPVDPQIPLDGRPLRFKKMLRHLSDRPLQWNQPDLLDHALTCVPLETLHREAEKEFQALRMDAATYLPVRPPILGFQDCVIRALLRWFKRSFFSWVDNPTCSRCGGKTTPLGMGEPLVNERAGGANQVEIYRCDDGSCGSFERFPRYHDPFTLLHTRKGRSGEWTLCFSMLCHAIGARVRWVWSSEDHSWTEVYSEHQKRWIHVDTHAEAWDEPSIYCEGWGQKLSYCIAFSKDGATDVTRRYVRSQGFAGARKRASEAELLHILNEICAERRKDMSAEQKIRLKREDEAEQRELQAFVLKQITQELCSLDVAAVSTVSSCQPDIDEETADSVKGWRLSDNVVIG
ncbi:Protein png1 [Diplodia seriata]|uniref:Protein png1 n=1 Tax=Diplodia seriata TaxID=420778 RepID=A0A1S8BLY8_9PEZI|nr:Protein png1 [Diplodia seriata]